MPVVATAPRLDFDRHLHRTFEQVNRARADLESDVVTSARPGIDRVSDDPGSPMSRVAEAIGLAADQVDFVWAVVACSIDPRVIPLLESLGGGHARRGLSLAVHAMLGDIDDVRLTSLGRWLAAPNLLVDTGLIVATESASPAARAYVASPRLVAYLAGDESSISPLRLVRALDGALHDPRQAETIDLIAAAVAQGTDAIVVVEGPAGSGRVTACACACDGVEMVVVDLARTAREELAEMLVALRRECVLRDALPVLANADHVLGDDAPEVRRLVGGFLDGAGGTVFVTTTVAATDVGTTRALVRIPWQVASTAVRAEMWVRAVASAGAAVGPDLDELAHRYRVGPGAISRAVSSAVLARGTQEIVLDASTLASGLRHNIAERLGGLARRVEVTQSWDDLVIADDTADLIAGLVGRVRHAHKVLDRWGYRSKIARGAGVAALFSGAPGTGKTMVAGLIAKELDLELYQVDLSNVVSKWVGETEKNLARVFDAAEEGHALLLFDEADALFGARSSDPKSANDRYANMEVNYLLQRVEAFGGITVLTTNLDTAIDPALKRRLAAHVVFGAPDEEERTQLWERQIVTGTSPLAADIDLVALARLFPLMTGANIRNAAISAAFLAATDDATNITQAYLMRAARAEYRAMGHMVSDSVARSPHRGGAL